MAKIEFFKISIKNKERSNIKNINLAQLVISELEKLSTRDKYCKHHKCDASMLNFFENTEPFNSITFDFIKFTPKVITSTIISQPKESIDTFQYVNTNIIRNSEYTPKDIHKVRKIVNKKGLTLLEITEKLHEIKLNNFSISKLLKEENINKKEDSCTLIDIFDEHYLKRVEKDETYFNITQMASLK